MAKEFEIDAYRRNRELLIILRGRLVLNYCQDTKTRLFTLFSPQVDKVYLYLNELAIPRQRRPGRAGGAEDAGQ